MKKLLLLTAFSFVLLSCTKEEVEATPKQIDKEQASEFATAKASFDLTTNNGFVDEGVNLSVSNTSKNAVSYLWDFGNGEISTEKNPSYNFNMHGNYNVSLTVTDASGNKNTYTQEVGVLCVYGGNH